MRIQKQIRHHNQKMKFDICIGISQLTPLISPTLNKHRQFNTKNYRKSQILNKLNFVV